MEKNASKQEEEGKTTFNFKTRIQIWHFQSVKHFHFQFDLDNGLIEECVERKLSQKLGPNSTSQVPISHFSFRLLVVSYLSQDHIG